MRALSTALAGSRLTAQAPSQADVLAQMGQENFPVASRLLGPRARAQLIAIYGFARLVDDVGDEAPGDRLALLDGLDAELDSVYAGRMPEHPVMRRLAQVVRAQALPENPFRRLVEANRRDQTVNRYETFEDLLGYCRLSAAPVGELVLHIFGAATADRIELSDRVCAGLQVIEHLQDIGEDYRRGRIYLPLEDLARFGVREAELGASSASRSLRRLIAHEAERAGRLLGEGAPLAARLGLRPRAAVGGFIAGGRAALAGLERVGYDTLSAPPGRPRSAFVRSWIAAVRGR